MSTRPPLCSPSPWAEKSEVSIILLKVPKLLRVPWVGGLHPGSRNAVAGSGEGIPKSQGVAAGG